MGWAQFVFCLASVVAQLSFARSHGSAARADLGVCRRARLQTACLRPALELPAVPRAGRHSSIGVRCCSLRANTAAFRLTWSAMRLASSARDRLIQVVLGFGRGCGCRGSLRSRISGGVRTQFARLQRGVAGIFRDRESRQPRRRGALCRGLVEATFVVLVVPYIAFAIEAPALTDALLSRKWHGTGPYLQALAGPALMLAATCWLDRAFDSFRRQHVAFSLEASFTLISIAIRRLVIALIDAVSVVWGSRRLHLRIIGSIPLRIRGLRFSSDGLPTRLRHRILTAAAALIFGALCPSNTRSRLASSGICPIDGYGARCLDQVPRRR